MIDGKFCYNSAGRKATLNILGANIVAEQNEIYKKRTFQFVYYPGCDNYRIEALNAEVAKKNSIIVRKKPHKQPGSTYYEVVIESTLDEFLEIRSMVLGHSHIRKNVSLEKQTINEELFPT